MPDDGIWPGNYCMSDRRLVDRTLSVYLQYNCDNDSTTNLIGGCMSDHALSSKGDTPSARNSDELGPISAPFGGGGLCVKSNHLHGREEIKLYKVNWGGNAAARN